MSMWSKDFRLFPTTAVVVATLLLAASCTDDTGPGRVLYGRFALEPVFVSEAAGIVPVTAGRFVLRRTADAVVVKDTVIALGSEVDSVDLTLTVPLGGQGETFELTIALIGTTGDTVFRAGPLTVTPSVGGDVPPAIPIPVVYTGVGADASSVLIQSPIADLFFSQQLTLQAVVLDSAGQPIPNTPVEWRTLDSAKIGVARPDSGRVVAGTQRGVGRIVARLLTGQADTLGVPVLPTPNTILVDGGNNQSGAPGTQLPQALVARVMAADALGVEGIWVPFTITAGGGSLSADSVLTDAFGRAFVDFTLGASGPQTVEATTAQLVGQTAVFGATVVAQRATALVLNGGDGQTGTVGQQLEGALVVEARDATNEPFPGDTVVFTIIQGGGSVSSDTVVTNVNGQALTFWTLGTVAGNNEVRAALITNAASLDINATATPDAATRLAFTVQPGASLVNNAITPAPAVTAFDQFNNVATSFAGTVSLTLLSNPPDATLAGGSVVSATAGVATFPGLSLNLPGTGFTLQATDGGLVPDTSSAFDVVVPQGNVLWINPSGGTWSVGSNWNTGAPPTAADTALIVAPGSYTVTLTAPATAAMLVVGGASGAQTVSVGSQTLTVGGATTIGSTGTLAIQGGTFDGPDGTLINAGTIILSGGNLSDVVVNNGLMVVQGNSGLSGLITGPGSLVRVEGTNGFGNGTLTVATGFTNTETIELTNAAAPGFTTTLAVTAGTLVNQGTLSVLPGAGAGPRTLNAELDHQGTLDVQQSLSVTNAGRTFTTTAGTLAVAGGQTLTINNGTTVVGTTTSLAGTGTIDLAGTHTWTLASDFPVPATGVQWSLSGGVTVTGPGVLTNQGTLTLTGDAVNADVVNNGTLVVQGTTALNGALTTGSGSLVRVEGTNGFGNGTLTVATGFTNTETIELTNAAAPGFTTTLAVTAGTLVNQGTVSVLPGAGAGPRTLNASVASSGTLQVDQALTWNNQPGPSSNSGTFSVNAGFTLNQGAAESFTNGGPVLIAAGQTVTVTGGTFTNAAGNPNLQIPPGFIGGEGTLAVSGTTFINDGTVAPGFSPGLLSLTGGFPVSASALLDIELSGTTVGTGYDRLQASGAATLDGTLNVSLINGFTPAEGNQFTILTYGSVNGDFRTVNLPALLSPLGWQRTTGATGMVLTVTGPPAQIVFAGDSAGGLSSGVFRVSADGTGQFNLTLEGRVGDVHPRWSPDRTRLAYTANPGGEPNQLHVISPDRLELAHLTSANDTSTRRARWSPDGKHLAFECGDGGYEFSFTPQDVCVIPDVTGPILSLEGIGNDPGGKVYVTDMISPDLGGSGAFAWDPFRPDELVVVRDSILDGRTGRAASQFWRVAFDGTVLGPVTATVLATGGGDTLRVITMDWSPDGSFIAFDAVSQTGVRAIYRVDVADGKITQLTTPGFGIDFRPVVSPDGASILFGRTSDGWQVMQVSSGGGAAIAMTPLLNFGTDQGGWDWSPDGLEVVLTEDVTTSSVVISKINRATTAATFTSDVKPVGRRGLSFEVQDRQPTWRP